MLLYILADIEKLPQHLKLVGNLARLLDSAILVAYFSDKKGELESFQAIQQEFKSMSNHSKIKFSFFGQAVDVCTEIRRIQQEKDICALAFSSKETKLVNSIFGNFQVYTNVPVFAL